MWSKKHCDNQPNTDLKEVIGNFLEFIQFYKIPANILMKEIHPLGLVPYHIIMNALAYQVRSLPPDDYYLFQLIQGSRGLTGLSGGNKTNYMISDFRRLTHELCNLGDQRIKFLNHSKKKLQSRCKNFTAFH